jgi:hypothetical protein
MTEITEGFKIDVGSDQAHERLVADIYYRGLYVGSVTEEGEIGRFDFEHNKQAPGAETDMVRCPLLGFLAVVQEAAEHLRQMKHRDAST